MKRNNIFVIIAVMLIVLTTCMFTACKKDETPSGDNAKEAKLELTLKEATMIVGESFKLPYKITNGDEKSMPEVTFVSEGDAVDVDKSGMITAKKTGDSKITATIKDSDQKAECKITVCNIIVDKNAQDATEPKTTASENSGSQSENDSQSGENQDGENVKLNYGGQLGTTLFKTVAEGLAASKDGDVVIIKEGDYGETVSIAKSVTIKGVKTPKLKGAEIEGNKQVTLEGITFNNTEYPTGSLGMIYVKEGASVSIKNCILNITTTEELSGGYGIFVEKQANKVEISNNTLSNFRYGIFVCATDKEVKITDNKLSNMEVGIGLDIRQENSTENYPTKGEIKKNTYNETKSKTQFLHYGDNYDGEFDFEDNELENAATDEGQTGGSGITE